MSEPKTQKIRIANETYEVLDALNNITLADSFVKNKTGTGHGEAKLYVGNVGERYHEFFDNIDREFFFLKEDFDKYLLDAKEEYMNPQQDYVKKDKMPEIYSELQARVSEYAKRIMSFSVYRKDVNPPRVYLQSDSDYYDLMRSVGIPNISYLSIMKVKSPAGKIYYYCRIFIDYKSDIVKYESPLAQAEEKKIIESDMSDKKKQNLVEARQGQGEYRRKLIEDCQFCPFTLVNDERLLIASHIKPWARSTDEEKVDYKNGFALTPTYDRLFDQGFITFNDDKTVTVSPWISPMNQHRLNIYDGMNLPKLQLDDKRCKYLEYHRANVYKG